MTSDQAGVLDASALLAYLHDELAADAVRDAIETGASMSMVNLAEVLSKLAEVGHDPIDVVARLRDEGILDVAIRLHDFDETQACETARLRPLTRSAGLSFGDRACMALARRLGVAALTTDRAWTEVDVDVQVVLAR